MARTEFKLGVTVSGRKATKAKLKRMSVVANDKIREIVQRSALRIQNVARQNIRKDTAGTAKTIRARFHDQDRAAEIGTESIVAVYIEFGTRPHPTAQSQAPRPMPPQGVLLNWMRRHGIRPDEGQTVESLEFLIRRHIRDHGTEAAPFLFPAWEAERPSFMSDMQRVLGRELRQLGKTSRNRARTTRSQ